MRKAAARAGTMALLAWGGIGSCASRARPAIAPEAAAVVVYVGTYTAPGVAPEGRVPSTALGIYVFRMNSQDGSLSLLQVAPTENPSFLALAPSRTHLYCTNQNDRIDGTPAGRVSAFAIDPNDGTLTFLNTQPTRGTHPAHLSVHPSGRHLLASNYGEGDYPIYRLLANGSIGPRIADVRGEGSGPDAERQEGPHAHQVLTDPQGRHVFGVDLGADRVLVWSFDVASETVRSSAPIAVTSGAGPRHLAFHPSRAFAYLLNELDGSILAFRHDAEAGALGLLQTISTLPPGFAGSKSTSEIRIHPNGRFLYSTNRGHNSVAVFEVDERSGTLHVVEWVSTRGEWPRGMNIEPSGRFLYAANQNSDSITVYRIDPVSGRLTFTGVTVHTPTPVDIEFGTIGGAAPR